MEIHLQNFINETVISDWKTPSISTNAPKLLLLKIENSPLRHNKIPVVGQYFEMNYCFHLV